MSSISFWGSVSAFSTFKFLFICSYRSTDFEVHRNWLAITNSLPLEKWYYEDTSEWTLDYPPFFSYFEWILSQVANLVDSEMLKLSNLKYASTSTIIFQKLTVILTDLFMAFSITKYAKIFSGSRHRSNVSLDLFILIFINAGLLFVDQIHFQYNGFLFGLLVLSIAKILQENYFQGAFFFAVLLNFKHIFLYMAPAFGIFLFSKYCFQKRSYVRNLRNLAGLAVIVIAVFSASFGPFYQHIPQVLKRLFPFKRGLSHAYWAPNVWAVYNTVDLVLSVVLGSRKSGVTGGLVGQNSLAVLPQIQPFHTFGLTLVCMLPILYQMWRKPTNETFLHGIILTAWTSFMFGYHVHEKAILNVIIPFSLFAILEPNVFIITLVAGTVSLFPLLFTPFESVMKILFFLFQLCLIFAVVLPFPKFMIYERLYLIGFIPLIFIEIFLPIFLPMYPFLPLICISDYCFLGLFYSYVKFYMKKR